MKYITLSSGEQAIVDDEDYEELNKRYWHIRSGYAASSYYAGGKGRSILMHHFVLHVIVPRQNPFNIVVDHINYNKLDNRKENLRLVPRSINNVNRSVGMKGQGKSQYRGVYYVASRAKKNYAPWRATLSHKVIGHYGSEEEAARFVHKAIQETLQQA